MATVYVPKGTTDLGTLTIADGDRLVFSEGAQIVDTGLNLSGLAVGLIGLDIQRRFAGRIGGDGGALRVSIPAGVLRYNAQDGALYLEPEGAADIIAKIIAAGGGRLHLVNGGTVTNLEIAGAWASVSEAVAVTNLRMSGGTVIQKYSATANTSWWIDGGELHSARGCSGTARIAEGATVRVERADGGLTLPTAGTIECNGRLIWRGGNITKINLGRSGMIDLREAPEDLTLAVEGSAQAIKRSVLASKYADVTATVTEHMGEAESMAFGAAGSETVS